MPIDLLQAAREIIALDSRSSLSDRPLVDHLAPLCREAGLTVSLQTERRDGVEQCNLLAARGPRPETGSRDDAVAPALLLATHLDTVPPGDEALWSATGGDAYRMTERDGELYGLGVADVKLDFLCKLLALERLKEHPLARPVLLAGTYGEEVGRWGARLLARETRPRPAAALVGEATGLRPCTAHKGYLELRCGARAATRAATPTACWRVVFEGVAAHSSQVDKGVSANDACLDALRGLTAREPVPILRLRGGELVNKVAAGAEMLLLHDRRPAIPGAGVTRVSCPGDPAWSPALVETLLALHDHISSLRDDLRAHEAPGFEPPFGTVNNGLVSLTAGELSYAVDVRSIPTEVAAEALRAHMERLRQPIARTPGSDLELRIERAFDDPPFAATPGSPLRRRLRRVLRERGLPLDTEFKSGTTEATVYSRAGMDTLVFGPGEATGNIHRPNEHVPLDHLRRAVDVYQDIVVAMCGGG